MITRNICVYKCFLCIFVYSLLPSVLLLFFSVLYFIFFSVISAASFSLMSDHDFLTFLHSKGIFCSGHFLSPFLTLTAPVRSQLHISDDLKAQTQFSAH